MPTYILTEMHYLNETLLPAGTRVGDGTRHPFDGEPSASMVSVDVESERRLQAWNRTHPGEHLEPDEMLAVASGGAVQRPDASIPPGQGREPRVKPARMDMEPAEQKAPPAVRK